MSEFKAPPGYTISRVNRTICAECGLPFGTDGFCLTNCEAFGDTTKRRDIIVEFRWVYHSPWMTDGQAALFVNDGHEDAVPDAR